MATAETLNDPPLPDDRNKVILTVEGEQQRGSGNINTKDDENCSQIIKNPTSIILGTSSHKKEKEDFLSETNHSKSVSEEEQQGEILAFYGEEEADSYRESPELVPVKPDGETLSKAMPQSQKQEKYLSLEIKAEKQPITDNIPTTSVEVKVEPEGEKEPPLAENMGKCEFCGHIGIRETFFSKSKRFCKMECAKRYSASNIKKKSKGEKIGTSKKKSRASVQVKTVKAAATPATQQTSHVQDIPIPVVAAREVGESWQNQAFDWGDYLKKTGAKAAASFLFKHVSLNPCLKGVHVGMKVEVVNCGIDVVDDTDVAFWVATVIHIQQYRVLLRYEGYEDDPTGDFWFDLRSKNIHPVGWCARRNKLLIPPPAIREKCTNWRDYLFKCLSGAKTFSAEFLQQLQNQSYNRFQKGMKVEVADRKNMYSMCVATIVDVIGDRLRLRYDGLDADIAEDFWCHYQSAEIHPIGWSSLVGHTLQPPIGWKQSLSKWNEFLAEDLANSVDAPQEFFVQDSTGTAPGEHQFKIGMKFEAIDPFNPSHICVVTVIKALRFNYFVLGVDSLATYFVCHANSRSIFPCGWSKRNGIELSPPRGAQDSDTDPSADDYSATNFNWPEYLAKTGGIEAPPELFRQDNRTNGFRIGMKLEAVDLREPALVCPGTITDLKGPLLRIHFDGWDDTYDQLLDMDSLDIFPVSWCSSVGHPLQPPGPMPDKYVERYGPLLEIARQPVARPPPASRAIKPAKRKPPTEEDKSQKKKAKVLYANEIVYCNKKCYSGPYLSRDLMRNLPDTIKGCVSGPEKHNIMRQCLQHFVSVANNPKQVLELFSREFYQNKKNKELHLGGTVCIETKSKNGKRLMRRVRVANKPDHLQAYFERVCQVLNCCSELISFTRYPLGYCTQTCLGRAKDNGVTSTSDGRTHEFLQPIVSEASLLPSISPTTSLPGRGEMRTPPGRSFSESPHDSMVSSTSNLAASPAQQHQDSEAASVLLYQSSHTGKDPRQWNVQEVSNFMVSIGCSNYAEAFTKEEIDGKALLLLTQEMLESLTENKLGPMTKIQNAVRALKQAWGI